MKRTVFFVSDGTGITAETLGYSLVTQFEDLEFDYTTLPYVDTPEKAQEAVVRINNVYKDEQKTPLVFATLVNAEIRNIISTSLGMFLDFFSTFIGPIETELQSKSSYTIGRTHSVHNPKAYNSRINAINYTLNTDDGTNIHQYKQADIIMVGVSRSGKTPTCLYLSLQFGLKAANYPITEDDLNNRALPKPLQGFQHKLFGLTIDPLRLQAIRKERRPDTRYASLSQCELELKLVEQLFRIDKIPFINTSNLSIEEISTRLMAELGIQRRFL